MARDLSIIEPRQPKGPKTSPGFEPHLCVSPALQHDLPHFEVGSMHLTERMLSFDSSTIRDPN